jgi:hypothetical protein
LNSTIVIILITVAVLVLALIAFLIIEGSVTSAPCRQVRPDQSRLRTYTEKVIRDANDGLPLEAFIHRGKTQRTETYTDSDGRTQTRTVTDKSLRDPHCDDDALFVLTDPCWRRLGWQEGPV